MSRVSPDRFVWGENKNWAIANKQNGAYSLASGLIGTTAGCIKTCTNEDSFINKLANFTQSTAYGARSNFQYSIYSRKEDDDLGEDLRDRPHAANVGEIACFIEKKVNPFLLPLSSLFGKNISESYSSIAHWFNALWWRLRLCSKNIAWKNINLGLIQKVKTVFNKDISLVKRNIARKQVENTISPILGLVGCLSMAIFSPIKAWNNLRGNKNRIIDSLSKIGITTQHTAYIFKFTLEELFNANGRKSEDSKLLFSLGIGANTMNIGLPLIELLPIHENILGTGLKLYKELATGFTAAFFSTRRHLMGKEWLEANEPFISQKKS